MKKGFLFAAILLVALSFTNSASAQTKIGYFDDQSVIALFPGIQEKLDTILKSYAQDTLQEEYNYTLKDYQVATIPTTSNATKRRRTFVALQTKSSCCFK